MSDNLRKVLEQLRDEAKASLQRNQDTEILNQYLRGRVGAFNLCLTLLKELDDENRDH